MTTPRRWLQTAIKTAATGSILLPWAAKCLPEPTAEVIRLIPAQKPTEISVQAA